MSEERRDQGVAPPEEMGALRAVLRRIEACLPDHFAALRASLARPSALARAAEDIRHRFPKAGSDAR